MKLGDEIPPAFTFDPPNATDQGVTVVSSDPDIVFIDENNVCIAVGLGTAEVTVTSVSNPEASDTVTVVVIEADRIPVTGITVSQEDPGATGTERQLLATVLPEEATDPSVTWSSSDDTIASIDDNGLLTGLSAGTATITATSVSDPEISGSVQIEITGVSLLSANAIEAFALNGQIETATIDTEAHTVSVTVPEGTALNVAPITLAVSEGATVAPGLLQARDFSSPVEYTVTSGNGTEQVWTVTAKVLTLPVAGDTDITAFGLQDQNRSTIDPETNTVTVNVPDGTDLNVAPQLLEVSPGATVAPAIGQVQDFSQAVTYTVTPETGTPQVWTVNVTVSVPEGSGDNAITAFELLGQTDVDIDDTAGTVTVTVPNGTELNSAPSVLNISPNATVNPAIGDAQDFSGAVTYTVTAENGDEREWTVNVTELLPVPTESSANDITAFVIAGQNSSTFDSDNSIISVNVPDGTDLNVAPQNLEVSLDATILPAIDVVQDFNTQVVYTVTAENGDEQDWTVNVTVSAAEGSVENAITAFELTGQTDVDIDDTTSTITVTVPNGTDLNMAPSVLNVSDNATVNPAIGDVQDFSLPVAYTVTAENEDERVWTVNVTVTSSSNKSIDSFVVDGVSGTVNGTDISLTLPFGTDVTALSPEIEFFGQSVNPSSGTPTDFTNDVVYTVTAEDNSTLDYTVAVIIAAKTNTAPTAEDFPVSVNRDSNDNSIDLSPHINDADEDELEVAIISDFRNGTATVSGNTIVYTPAPGYTGIDSIVYTVNDGNGGEVTATVTVTVNTQPTAEDFSVNVEQDSKDNSIDLSTRINDADGDELTISVKNNYEEGSATISGNTMLYTPNPGYSGIDSIVYTVSDGNGGEDTATVTFTVMPAAIKKKPIVSIVDIADITLPTNSVELSGSATDEDGTIVSYEWTKNSGPAANITNAISSATMATDLVAGDYVFRLTATDNDTGTGSNTVAFTVIEAQNKIPVAVSSADAINGNAPLTVKFTGSTSSDPDDDDLSYIWNFGDGSTSISEDPTHEFSAAGTYDVVLTVTDDGNPERSDTATTITIEVGQANQIPIAVSSADVTNGNAPLTVKFTGSDSSDPDADDTLSYFWDFGDGNNSTLENPSHEFSSAGTYDVVLTVTDDGSPVRSGTAPEITIELSQANQSPKAVASADVTNGEAPLTISFTGDTSSDPDNDTLSYLWDFGDGSTSTLQNPTHVFQSPTTYNVVLTVTDDGSPSLSDEASAITIEAGNANQFPVAVASANTTNGNAPLTVNFTGSDSSDPDANDILSYFWDFGDGNTSTLENPSHEFAAGTYDVVLTVTDDASQPRSNSATAIRIEAGIANRIPVALSSADFTNGNAPLTVKFTGSNSSDPDNDTLSYLWNFGDGSTSESENPVHEFSAAGSYEVVLTVTDNGSPVLSNVATTITIEVNQANQSPTATASADVLNGTAPLTVKFTGSTSSDPDDDSLSYFWDFGDGGTSTSDDPTHKFSAADTYNVVLTVTDDGNPVRSNSVSLSIEVDPNTAPVAVNDTFTVGEAGILNELILTNDTDSEDEDLTVNWIGGSTANVGQSVGGSDGGLFTITAGGGLNFNTNNDFDGLNDGETQTTTIQYRITDGNSNSNTATVTVTVTGVDDPNNSPTAVILTTAISGTTPLSVDFTGDQSFDNDGSIVSYFWEFGENNRTSSEAN
ncbi:PKD domain-containing protein, partial [Zobellia uliginosa]|uniref:PKD domain-containing protein n=1 Tax=Zobellia uliginosa TaxID=143224 RepID=UPI001C06CDC1